MEEQQSILILPQEKIQTILTTLSRIELAQNRNVHDINTEFLYTDAELCQILKCSKKSAQNWRNRGFLGYVQLGGFIRYRKQDIYDFCEKFSVKPQYSRS